MTNVIEMAKQAGFQKFLKPADRPEMICDPATLELYTKLVRNAALSEAAQVCFRSAAYAGDPIDNARLMDCGAVILKLKEPTP